MLATALTGVLGLLAWLLLLAALLLAGLVLAALAALLLAALIRIIRHVFPFESWLYAIMPTVGLSTCSNKFVFLFVFGSMNDEFGGGHIM
jgi:hypothetical protein